MNILDDIFYDYDGRKIGCLVAIKRYAPKLYREMRNRYVGTVYQSKYLAEYLQKKGFVKLDKDVKKSLKPEYCVIRHGGTYFYEDKISEIFMELGIYDASGTEAIKEQA